MDAREQNIAANQHSKEECSVKLTEAKLLHGKLAFLVPLIANNDFGPISDVERFTGSGINHVFFLLSAVPILLQGGNYLVSVLCLLFFAMIILRYLHLSGREQILLESYIQSCCGNSRNKINKKEKSIMLFG